LENGRRLENMSWRLWYRESSLKESDHNSNNTPLSATCPIPIQQQTPVAVKDDNKHLSPASFKRIISSLNEYEIKQPPQSTQPIQQKKAEAVVVESPKHVQHKSNMIMFEQPKPQQQTQTQQSKFFIKEDEESDLDYEDEDGWSSEEEEEEINPTPKNTSTFNTQQQKRFAIGYNSVGEEDDDQYEDINDDDKEDEYQDCLITAAAEDESAFLSEFRKRCPPPINVLTTKKSSLLTNMFHSQGITRLANQPTITVTQNQQNEDELLSTSMRKCIEIEQHGHDFIFKKNNCDLNHDSFMFSNNSRVGLYW
jgi:hypothetical protein